MSMDTTFHKSVSVVACFGSLYLNFISMHLILLRRTKACLMWVCVGMCVCTYKRMPSAKLHVVLLHQVVAHT